LVIHRVHQCRRVLARHRDRGMDVARRDVAMLTRELVEVEFREVAVADDLVGGLLRNDAQPALDNRERAFGVDVIRRAILI
jgi:hypothetical protein